MQPVGLQPQSHLGSTDAVGRVPHRSPTQMPVHRCRVCGFFFFFFPDSR